MAKRRRVFAERPVFTRQDAWFLLELPLLAAIAMFVPESGWQRICVGLERLKAALGWFSPARIRDGLALRTGAAAAPDHALRVAAARPQPPPPIPREVPRGRAAPPR